MNPAPRRSTTCLLAAFLLAAHFGSAAAVAQPPERPPPAPRPAITLVERPLQEALDESLARSRVLVVVCSQTREKEKAAQALWSNPALLEWVRLHAVLVHVKAQKSLSLLKDAGMIVALPEQPLLFKAGKQERIFGSTVREDTGQPGGIRIRPAPRPERADLPFPPREDRPDGAIRLLLRLDWTLRALAAKDPAWGEAHRTFNPAPEAPRVGYAFQGIPDGPDAALGDPAGGVGGKPDSVTRFALATILADKPESIEGAPRPPSAPGAKPATPPGVQAPDALELFTWLWDRAGEHHPTFKAVAVSSLARRWHNLATKDEAFRTRARTIRDATSVLLPWGDYQTWFEWLILSRMAGEHLDLLDFLDAALDDADAKGMMPAADYAAFEAMLPWLNWVDPRTIPGADGDPMGPLEALRRRADAKAPTKVSPEQWWTAQQFFNWLLRVECSRVYASMLAAGEPAIAARAAKLLREVDPAEGPVWLTTAALCESQPRKEQAEWLAGNKDAWAKSLAGHVEAAMANPPK